MDQPSRGRHRRAPVRRSLPLAATLAAVLVLVTSAVAVTAWLVGTSHDREPAASPTATTTVTESAPSTSGPVTLTGARDVRVDGDVVTVTEQTTVTTGDGVVVRPARRSTEPALQLTGVDLVAEDGTVTTFGAPVSLTSGRSLTVRGTYLLRDCPDLLPVDWPSPAEVAGASWARTWTRSSEPLRTAPTLCPGRPSTAAVLPSLTARLAEAGSGSLPRTVRILLRWDGFDRLAVDGLGALSDLAADVALTRPSGDGCPATGCIGPVPPTGGLVLDIRPVEACPNSAPRPDRLTLVVRRGAAPPLVAAVAVPGLGRWLGSHVCR